MAFSLFFWADFSLHVSQRLLFHGAGTTLGPWSIMSCRVRVIHSRQHSAPSPTPNISRTLHSELDFADFHASEGVKASGPLEASKSTQNHDMQIERRPEMNLRLPDEAAAVVRARARRGPQVTTSCSFLLKLFCKNTNNWKDARSVSAQRLIELSTKQG